MGVVQWIMRLFAERRVRGSTLIESQSIKTEASLMYYSPISNASF